MARKPKAIEASDDRLKLLQALAFVSVAIEKADEGKSSYVTFRDRWLYAENDTYTIGIPVDVALELCPQADKFKAALQQCGQLFQLTQVDINAVSLRSGAFRALVPALSPDLGTQGNPDIACAVINSELRKAFEACGKAMNPKGERVYHKSVLLRSGSMVGTNGGIAIEYWHGIDLPGPLAIPRKAVEALAKIDKPMAAFGFSGNSVTIYYEDHSFLKTRLMSEAWPDVDRFFNYITGSFLPVWPQLFAGIKAIEAFIPNDTVHFHNGYVASHNSLELGASYKVQGMPGDFAFSATYWRILEPFIERVCLPSRRDAPTAFIGPNVRGLIMGKTA